MDQINKKRPFLWVSWTYPQFQRFLYFWTFSDRNIWKWMAFCVHTFWRGIRIYYHIYKCMILQIDLPLGSVALWSAISRPEFIFNTNTLPYYSVGSYEYFRKKICPPMSHYISRPSVLPSVGPYHFWFSASILPPPNCKRYTGTPVTTWGVQQV